MKAQLPTTRTAPKNRTWWLYLVRRSDGALYTGIALDVAARLAQHRAGRGAKSLRGRGPLELSLRCRIGPLGLALRLERAVKRLTKAHKEELLAERRRWREWLRTAKTRASRAASAEC